MVDDGVDEGHRLGPEVTPAVLPLVVLLGEDHPDESNEAGRLGKIPTTAVRRYVKSAGRRASRSIVRFRPRSGCRTAAHAPPDAGCHAMLAAIRRCTEEWSVARDEKLELLRSIPLFAGFGRRELERLSQLTDQVDLPEGRVLMRQGESGSEAFIIMDGSARVERDGVLLSERTNGEILGEIAILDEGHRTATVTLTAPSRLLVVGHR